MEIVNYWLCNCAKKTHKAIGSHRWWVIPFRCQRVRNRVFTLITTLGGHQKNLKSVFVKLWDVSLITLPILSTNMNSNRTRTYPILATSLGTLFYPLFVSVSSTRHHPLLDSFSCPWRPSIMNRRGNKLKYGPLTWYTYLSKLLQFSFQVTHNAVFGHFLP